MEKEFSVLYLIFINLLSFILFAVDKCRAKKKAYRIKESVLLFTAFIGGAFGALTSMLLFRHKTQKIKFTLLVPLFLIAQVFLGYYAIRGFV
ncbi:MAG: DUF1294 domain-containing protein [Ruminococcaceae bacterium]|nr:DUF1294 domain-containing protein [Oscillospiraceae bacterium]